MRIERKKQQSHWKNKSFQWLLFLSKQAHRLATQIVVTDPFHSLPATSEKSRNTERSLYESGSPNLAQAR